MERKILHDGISPNQAAAIALTLPHRFFKAFPLLTSEHTNELMKDRNLADLWMYKVLRMRMKSTVPKLTVWWPNELADFHKEWLPEALQPIQHLLLTSSSQKFEDEFCDIKMVLPDWRIYEPESWGAYAFISFRNVSDPKPMRFVSQGKLSHWYIDCQHQDSQRDLRLLLTETHAIKNS